MLRISQIDARAERRLVVEGKLIAPWTAELSSACELARSDLKGRQLVIDVRNVTAISEEGENVILELLKKGTRFRCSGVFTKYVLAQVARKMRKNCPPPDNRSVMNNSPAEAV